MCVWCICCIMYYQHLKQYSRGWHSRVLCLTLSSHVCVCVSSCLPVCVYLCVPFLPQFNLHMCPIYYSFWLYHLLLPFYILTALFFLNNFAFIIFHLSSFSLFIFLLLFLSFFLSFSLFFFSFYPLCRTLWEATLRPSLSSLCPRPGEDRDGIADISYCVV